MSNWMEYLMNKYAKEIKRFEVIEQLHKDNLIDGRTNQEVYQSFLDRHSDSISIIGVSRIITRHFDYVLHDKKIDGKKRRVFVRK